MVGVVGVGVRLVLLVLLGLGWCCWGLSCMVFRLYGVVCGLGLYVVWLYGL